MSSTEFIEKQRLINEMSRRLQCNIRASGTVHYGILRDRDRDRDRDGP